MKRLPIPLPGRAYDILIGRGLLEDTGRYLSELFPPCRAAVVSDETVYPLYGQRLTESLQQAGFQPFSVLFPAGEQTKSFGSLEKLSSALLAHKLQRHEPIIALGGGVIGDLAGFGAAIYMRGTPFVQVPTTLLAQVDSSVGGKVAVNLPEGKNMVGAFHQPRLVLADTDTLSTLSDRDFASGMAEVVKTAVIGSVSLFEKLEIAENRKGIEQVIGGTIEDCCRFKGHIVIEDERERDLRRILNFGHSFGHAIEKLGGFSRYTHGEAVSIGMVMAATIGCRLGITESNLAERVSRLCRGYGLPVDSEFSIRELLPAMENDKKNAGDGLTLVLAEKIGKTVIRKISADRVQSLSESGECDG